MRRMGFTLIEVMISMFIMAMLSILVSTSVRSAVQNKKKIEARMESQTMLFDAIRIMKQDIERAFNYQDVFFQIENLALQQLDLAKQQNSGGGAFAPGSPQRIPPIRLTHFLGEDNRLNFTTLNHFRTKYNAQESDQMEVGYFLDSCKNPDGKGTSQCLWRRSNVQIDDNVEEGGSKLVVARNVSSFKLTYRSDKEVDEWLGQWRSDNRGRPDHQNKFPTFVKIEMEIADRDNPKVVPIKQSLVVRVQFPNNESFIQQAAQQPGQLGQPAQSGMPQ